MTSSTGVLVAVGAVAFEADVLAAAEGGGLHVVRRCVDIPDLLASAISRQAQVALVSVELAGLDGQTVTRLGEEQVRVIGVTDARSGPDVERLRGLGVENVVVADERDSLRDAVAAVVDQATEHAAPPAAPLAGAAATDGDAATGTLVGVWGPGGAPGRSTVSLGVSAELAAHGVSTLLIDADTYGGALAQLLGMLDESSGILAAARAANAQRLNPEQLSRHARSVNSHLRVLTGLPRPDRWTEIPPGALREIVHAARALVDVVVVDCGFSLERDEEISYDTAAPRRNAVTLTTLGLADTLVVVGRADPVGLGRLARGLVDVVQEAPTAQLHVVVNRMRSTLGWSEEEVASTLASAASVSALTVLPEDQGACDRAVAAGRTLTESAPGSKLAKQLRHLAAAIADIDATTAAKRGRLKRRVRQRS